MDEQDTKNGLDSSIKPRNGRRKIKNQYTTPSSSSPSSSSSSSPGNISMDQTNVMIPTNEEEFVGLKCSRFIDAFNKMIASYPRRREEILLLKHHLPFHEKLDGMIQQLEELRRYFIINGSSSNSGEQQSIKNNTSSSINGQGKVSLKNRLLL